MKNVLICANFVNEKWLYCEGGKVADLFWVSSVRVFYVVKQEKNIAKLCFCTVLDTLWVQAIAFGFKSRTDDVLEPRENVSKKKISLI
jgi:hypothetical protein